MSGLNLFLLNDLPFKNSFYGYDFNNEFNAFAKKIINIDNVNNIKIHENFNKNFLDYENYLDFTFTYATLMYVNEREIHQILKQLIYVTYKELIIIESKNKENFDHDYKKILLKLNSFVEIKSKVIKYQNTEYNIIRAKKYPKIDVS